MGIITYGNWVTDLNSMQCWNCCSKIVISFEKNENKFKGKIKTMSAPMLKEWISNPLYTKHIRELIDEAETMFKKAWFENIVLKNPAFV